jgi:hypothetical protein
MPGLASAPRTANADGIASFEETSSDPHPVWKPFVAELDLCPGTTRVRAYGVLDSLAVSVIDGCLTGLWDAGLTTVELDLSGILYAEAEVAPTLDAWTHRADDRTGDLVLLCPRPLSGN